MLVGVVADVGVGEMKQWLRDTELECLQLHGEETGAEVAAMLPHAYKAVRVGSQRRRRGRGGVPRALPAGGRARVEGRAGSERNNVLDWSLVTSIARERKLTLAGGLTPENVRDAIVAVRPYCVDVASGVESAPGVKDLAKVEAFIAATHAVAASN